MLPAIGELIRNEILGMQWLDRMIGAVLTVLGMDPESRITGTVRFFLYDTVKITVLLTVLIFLISYIQSYFPPERSRRILGRFHGIAANLIGALLGTVTPFCSCSSIPLFIGFTRAGLPLGVTFSFLISSPMVDLGSCVLLMSIFGWKIALVYVVFGLIVAVIGGTLIEKLRMESQIEEFVRRGETADSTERRPVFRERLSFSAGQVRQTLKKVFVYILIGVGIGSVIHNWIPEALITRVLGKDNPLGVPMAVAVGVPMYADIFGTIPIAEALLGKGALLGVVLSFMMAVTTLSLPSLIMLQRVVKPKLLFIFIAVCVVGIILVGYIFNFLHPYLI